MNFGKKGSESQLWPIHTEPWWLLFCFVLTVAAIGFVFTVSKAGAEQSKIKENLESFILMQRFFESPACFVYEKGAIMNARSIDAEKFTEENLNSCYEPNENAAPAFRITLISDTAKISKVISTRNWNQNRQSEESKSKDVPVYSGGKTSNGAMMIEIQNLQ